MTQLGQQNHYNIKFLKGYGVSIRQKDHQIFLANGKDVFTGEQEKESYYIPQFPYEKIIISGDGYLSTRAVQLLLENNVNLILTDAFGGLITSMSTPMSSTKATKYRMGQYQTFADESKQIVLRKKFLLMKLEGQIQFLKSIRHIEMKQAISGLGEFKKKLEDLDTHNDIHDIEAKSARLYFENYQKLFDPKFEFTSRMSDVFNRSKENATNVINALLNYGYAVLSSEILKYVNAFGLDSYYGFSHRPHDSFMALVYDIIEPYRVLVDSTVYTVANYTATRTRIKKKEYARTKTGHVVLSNALINRFLLAFKNTLNRKREYKINRVRKAENGLCMAQESTIIKEEIQNLADYCITRKNAFQSVFHKSTDE